MNGPAVGCKIPGLSTMEAAHKLGQLGAKVKSLTGLVRHVKTWRPGRECGVGLHASMGFSCFVETNDVLWME